MPKKAKIEAASAASRLGLGDLAARLRRSETPTVPMRPVTAVKKVRCIRREDERTTCCGAYTTFVEDIECCKKCYEEVENPQSGFVFTVSAR